MLRVHRLLKRLSAGRVWVGLDQDVPVTVLVVRVVGGHPAGHESACGQRISRNTGNALVNEVAVKPIADRRETVGGGKAKYCSLAQCRRVDIKLGCTASALRQ